MIFDTHKHRHPHLHAHIHTYIYTYVYKYVYPYIYTHMYIQGVTHVKQVVSNEGAGSKMQLSDNM